MRKLSGLVCLMVFVCTAPAAAQSWSERVVISFNGAYQPSKHDFSDRFEFERNIETGSTQTDYPIKGGFTFDGGAGYRLWKNLGAGVGFSYFTRDDVGHTTSNVPHPLHFDQVRTVTGDASGVTRTERVVHVQAMYLWKSSGALRLVLSGGPSFFTVEQSLVSDVTVSETYPFDTADFGSATTTRAKASKPAFNVGADVMWMFAPNIGIGGIVRYSKASVDLSAPGSRTVSVDAGGGYAGGGVRLVF